MIDDYIKDLKQDLKDRKVRKVAEAVKMHPNTLYDWINGKRGFKEENLIKIDQYLNGEKNNG